jgi:hypothetical protein
MNYSNATLRPGQTSPQFSNYTQYQSPVSQPIFPQPSGNVYMVNNNLEVANIPIGVGMSAVLCLSENLLYIKTMQNNMPMLLGYKLSPLEPPTSTSEQPTEDASEQQGKPDLLEEKIKELTTQYEQKIKALEDNIRELDEKIGGIVKCQF